MYLNLYQDYTLDEKSESLGCKALLLMICISMKNLSNYDMFLCF